MAQQPSSNRSMRILALHGHRQSGDIFAKKTGALKKILSPLGVSYIHYPTAPHKIAEKNEDGGMFSCEVSNEGHKIEFSQ